MTFSDNTAVFIHEREYKLSYAKRQPSCPDPNMPIHNIGTISIPNIYMYIIICVWFICVFSVALVHVAGDLRPHSAHYDVIVMICKCLQRSGVYILTAFVLLRVHCFVCFINHRLTIGARYSSIYVSANSIGFANIQLNPYFTRSWISGCIVCERRSILSNGNAVCKRTVTASYHRSNAGSWICGILTPNFQYIHYMTVYLI